MLTTEIHEAAVEFGRSLRQAPAVSARTARPRRPSTPTRTHRR